MAKAAGRDPSELEVIVRANVEVAEKPLGKDRFIFTGSIEQIQEDVRATKNLDVQEVFFDPVFSSDGHSLDRFLKRMEQLRKLV